MGPKLRFRQAQAVEAIEHVVSTAHGVPRRVALMAELGFTSDERRRTGKSLVLELAHTGRNPRRGHQVVIDGKPALVPDTFDRIVGRMIAVKLRNTYGSLIPDMSAQRIAAEIPSLLATTGYVARIDVESCFEAISRDGAFARLADLGVRSDLIAWLRAWYRINPVRGLGRGPAWCPVISEGYLLQVFQALAHSCSQPDCAHGRWVRWLHDDFLIGAPTEAEARDLLDLAVSELGKLGLKISSNSAKFYIGPASGNFNFAGLEYDQTRAHLTPKAVRKLEARLADPTESPENTIKDFARRYWPTATSPRTIQLSNRLQEKYQLKQSLTELMLDASRRSDHRLQHPVLTRQHPPVECEGRQSLGQALIHSPLGTTSLLALSNGDRARPARRRASPPRPVNTPGAVGALSALATSERWRSFQEQVCTGAGLTTIPACDPPVALLHELQRIQRSGHMWSKVLCEALPRLVALDLASATQTKLTARKALAKARRSHGQRMRQVWHVKGKDGGLIRITPTGVT